MHAVIALLTTPRALLTIGALACLLCDVLVLRRAFHRPGVGAPPWFFAALAAAIWLPNLASDAIAALFMALVVNFGVGSGGWGLFVGALFTPLLVFVPGCARVVALGMAILINAVNVTPLWRARREMARARRLRPGEKPCETVQIGGRFQGSPPVTPPGAGRIGGLPDTVAAWSVRVGDKTFSSDEPLRLVGDHGVALVEPAGLTLDSNHGLQLSASSGAVDVIADLGESPAERECTLRWFALGDDGYVRGVPTWRSDPRGEGYRGSAFIPVFAAESPRDDARVGTDESVHVANRSLETLRDELTYRAASNTLWTIMCGAVVADVVLLHWILG